MDPVVHPSAIVDRGAVLAAGTRIWHCAHVCAGARIGNDCALGQNVYVGNDVVLGDRVKVQNNVSVYDAVALENAVFCGPSMVFTNVYNPRAAVSRKHDYPHTLVRRGATIGANATILCGVSIGEYAFVAAGAAVNRDVPAFALMAGVPARQIGWISRHGERLALPRSRTTRPVPAPRMAPRATKRAAPTRATCTCCTATAAASSVPPPHPIHDRLRQLLPQLDNKYR